VADRLNCRKYLVLGVLKTGGSSELKKKRFRVPENFDFSSFIILRGGLCDILVPRRSPVGNSINTRSS
jgi:hypothetical protein